MALAALQSQAIAGVPVVIHLAPGTYLLGSAPFVFDARTQASEVRLIGAAGTTLQAASPNVSLFKVGAGAPTITLYGLQLRSQVYMEAGALNVQNCTFWESSAEFGGALQVAGGSLAVELTVFAGCKATRGGAAWVSGGIAVFSSSTFEGCIASEEQGGGAVWVELSGEVVLRERTLLHGNLAVGLLDSIHIAAGGKLRYVLPAPLAHYIDLARDGLLTADYGGQPAIALKADKQYQDYPSACAAGVYGNSYDVVEQSSGLCSALCPTGYMCGASATITPIPCELGGYCREGSSTAQPCPSGRFGNMTGLTSADACYVCPPGTSCGIGVTMAVACTPGTYSANSSSAACLICPETTYQPTAGSIDCLDCGEGYLCPRGSSVRIGVPCSEGTYLPKGASFTKQNDCDPCPIGRWCVGGRNKPKPCSPGTVQPVAGTGACKKCAAGKYQANEGEQACVACQLGSYCPEGASAPLPCAEGSYSQRSAMRHDQAGLLRDHG